MRKKTQKKIFVSAISLVLAAAMVLGIWYSVTHSKKDPIPVIAFSDVGMTEYWGDNMESHGPVSSDNIQTVFLSDTQTVTEVLVKEGDTVKKGDPMMTFDTTLSSLDLERKRLEVEKLKLELLEAEDDLKTIIGMRPMQPMPELPDPPAPAPDLGHELTKPSRITGKPGFDGSSQNAPLICWIQEGREIDQRLVDEILEMSLALQVEDHAFPSAENGTEDPAQESTAQTDSTEIAVPIEKPEEPAETQTPAETTETQTPTQVPETPAPEETKAPETITIVQPASRENEKLAVVKSKELVFYAAPSKKAAVVKEVPCHQATVRVYDQVKTEGIDWAFTVLGQGDYAVEGWVFRKNLEISGEQDPTPTEPTKPNPTEPQNTEPSNPESNTVTVNFFIEPEEAEVKLWGASEGASVEKIGRNFFRVTAEGTYYYSIDHDGYKPISDHRLQVNKDNIELHISLKEFKDPDQLNSAYVIFKSTEKNMSLGNKSLWQGIKLYHDGTFRFYDASSIPDYTETVRLEGGEGSAMPDFDMGSGMTAAQIAEMRQEQEKKIEELKLSVKMAEADYKIKKRELDDGNIYAEFDGKVVSLLTEEDSRKTKKPMIKVSGGGGYQIEGSVNELDRETMKIGQKVTINDWNSGGSYEGKIIAIGEFPVRMRGYSGRGNPNSSYYPFTVFVDGDADLQTGSYVSIQYAAGESENGLYLNNPFIREEKGQSYVLVLGENDRLEKRPVTTGKSLWGSYTEILSGLSQEDYLAFPYGKNVKPGAKAEIGDMSDFYG